MRTYYISRILISLIFGGLQLVTGAAWGEAFLIVVILITLFMWAPRSGRYAVHPELGVTALRRDEYTQAINNKAARNAFVVISLALVGLVLFSGHETAVPVHLFKWLLWSGIGVYYLSDFLLRQRLSAVTTE